MVREEYNHSRPVSALIRDWLLHNKGGGGGGILKTVTGNPISVSDALANPIQSLSVSLSPIQTGSGDPSPDNVRPISGRDSVTVWRTGGNLFGGDVFANACHDVWGADINEGADGKYWTKPNGGGLSDLLYFSDYFKVKENTAYTFIFDGVAANNVGFFRIFYTDGTSALPLFPTTRGQVVFTSSASKTISGMDIINRSGDRTVYFATSGIFEGVLTAADFAPYDGTSVTIQLGQTVYGGAVEIISGQGQSTMRMVDLGTRNWVYDSTHDAFYAATSPYPKKYGFTNLISSAYKTRTATSGNNWTLQDKEIGGGNNSSYIYIKDTAYTTAAEFKTAMSGVMLCYELETSTEIETTPATLSTLKGQNNVWSDGDDVTMTYKAVAE